MIPRDLHPALALRRLLPYALVLHQVAAHAQVPTPDFDTLFARANAHLRGHPDSSSYYAGQLAAYAKTSRATHHRLLATWYEAALQDYRGEYEAALAGYEEVVAETRGSSLTHADSAALFRTYNSRAITYQNLGRPGPYYADRERARALVENLGVPGEHILFLNNQVDFYMRPETLDSMALAYEELMRAYERYGRPAAHAYGVSYTGGQVAIGTGQFALAERHFLAAAQAAEGTATESEDVLRAHSGRLAAVFTAGDYDRARTLHAELEPRFGESRDLFIRQYGATIRFMSDTAAGDYRAGIASQAALMAVNDSIAGQARQERVDELEATLAVERQAKEIETLEMSAQVARLTAQRQRSRLLTLGIGLLLVGTLLALLYRRYRQVQAAREEIERQRAELARANEQIGEELAAKSLLMQEIHHRAKNNLATIEGLLNLQLDAIEDDTAAAALQRSRERIHAVSLIHEQLHRSEEAEGTVSAVQYLGSLVEHLACEAEGVAIHTDIDDVAFDLSHAVSIGLLVNEAVMNSIEHAAVRVKAKEVSGLAQHEEAAPTPPGVRVDVVVRDKPAQGLIDIEVRDDGVGFSADAMSDSRDHGGLHLIRGLARQLKGTLELDNRRGARVHVSIPHDA